MQKCFSFQFEDLSFALYDQIWYELPLDQAKMLIVVMADLQNPVTITTGIQKVTLVWFANMVKAAYSMGKVMEELIKL